MQRRSLLQVVLVSLKLKTNNPTDTHANSQSGFTLIELIMVMIMVGTLAGFLANIIFYEINTYQIVSKRKAGMQDARFAFDKIARDLRQIAPDSLFQAAGDSIRFADVSNNQITYKFTNGTMLRNGAVLMDGLSDFQFTYFNNNDNVLTPPIPDLSDVSSIGLFMSLVIDGKTITSQLKVIPRNF